MRAVDATANVAECLFRRLKEYDFVGRFRVSYRQERVTLSLGSESLTTFDEADGARLLARRSWRRALSIDRNSLSP